MLTSPGVVVRKPSSLALGKDSIRFADKNKQTKKPEPPQNPPLRLECTEEAEPEAQFIFAVKYYTALNKKEDWP